MNKIKEWCHEKLLDFFEKGGWIKWLKNYTCRNEEDKLWVIINIDIIKDYYTKI